MQLLTFKRAARAVGHRHHGWGVPVAGALDADGNQRVNVDFRSVYASLLEQWFDHDATAVIPDAGRFARLALIA